MERMFIGSRDNVSWLFERVGVYAIMRFLTRKKVIILMYHGVTASDNSMKNCDTRHVHRARFLWQIEYLKKHYSFISFNDFMDWRSGKIKELPSNPVILTFDDGYKNNYTQLFPILEKNQIPAMIYLLTGMIGKKSVADSNTIQYCITKTKKEKIIIDGEAYTLRTPKERMTTVHVLRALAEKKESLERFLEEIKRETAVLCTLTEDEEYGFMTWEECHAVQKKGISFGSHTHSHPNLTRIEVKSCHQELKQAKAIINQKLGTCIHFCYPYGAYNDNIIEGVKKYYDTAVIIKHGYNTKKTDPYKLKRIPITSRNTDWSFVLDLFCNFSLFHHWLIVLYSYARMLRRK